MIERNPSRQLYAHTAEGRELEPLCTHAAAVAAHARRLAEKFDAGDLAYAAGLLHDLGKAKPAFQDYLLGRTKRSEPHSAEGARFAQGHYSKPKLNNAPVGRLLAFCIAGHHAGLANGSAHGGGTAPLEERLAQAKRIQPWFPPDDLPRLGKEPHPLKGTNDDPFARAFFTRMLFSALVDADFVETERWFNETTPDAAPRGTDLTPQQLKNALDAHIREKFESRPQDSDLARLRAEVLADCRAAATQPQGLFSLTVPTGGGKTLSSLAFALDHAVAHDLDRVIYVIPFTAIVEQTAAVFREALKNSDAILEHHSAFDEAKFAADAGKEADLDLNRLRLAAQNWDRPIVVTTAVQFFESLFANRPGRCRKLHNIARSVVILDEVQTLPVKLLRPCLAALATLVRGYRTSVVLCTATQPALTREAGLGAPEGLQNVREIIPDGRQLYRRLKRVRAEVAAAPLSDTQIIDAVRPVDRALVVVNNRRHARELFEAMQRAGFDGARHLTTAMTAAHRQLVFDGIRHDLDPRNDRPARVVATSLIEAGVDISFKAVWRAWAGLDQIVQAAGRCSRNGELGPEGGRLVIFEPEPGEGRGIPRELIPNVEAAQRVLRDREDPLSEAAVAAYFRELLWVKGDGGTWRQLDNVKVGEAKLHGIMTAIKETAHGLDFCFADIAQAFRIIEDTMVPVIIPASIFAVDGAPDEGFLNGIEHRASLGGVLRDLQRHTVQVPRKARSTLIETGNARRIAPDKLGEQFVVLGNRDLYSADSGLNWTDPTLRSVESLMF